GLGGGEVEDRGLGLEAGGEPLPHQAIDGGEKGRERLARSGGGGNQHVPPGLEGRPSLRLRRRGRSKAALKPGGNGRMKQGTWRHETGIPAAEMAARGRRGEVLRGVWVAGPPNQSTPGRAAFRIGSESTANSRALPSGRPPRPKTISSSPTW